MSQHCLFWLLLFFSQFYLTSSCCLQLLAHLWQLNDQLFTFLHYIEPVVQNLVVIPYPTAFPYGNGTVLHFYQQQESSTNKTVHKVINKGLKTYV